jgi:hypothetical protein
MLTLTLPGADVRGYYHQLGIHLPARASIEASVRCFAAPDAHRRGDRDPSCSVNMVNGAWHCHACGARGGAYDAALAKGHTPRAAIDLMIAHGLIERRSRIRTARELLEAPVGPSGPLVRSRARQDKIAHSVLRVTEQDIARWHTALSRRPCLVERLADECGWRYQAMRTLELGVDRGRITIPIRNARGDLRGLLRYQPDPTDRPKMLAVTGTRLGLIPHPAAETSTHILLVEGPPDMIAARSRGLAAIAVPGDHAWQPAWARLLAGREVQIVMDADRQGRAAAERIAHDLADLSQLRIVDLAPLRADGYDLTDWLLEYTELADGSLGNQLLRPNPQASALGQEVKTATTAPTRAEARSRHTA